MGQTSFGRAGPTLGRATAPNLRCCVFLSAAIFSPTAVKNLSARPERQAEFVDWGSRENIREMKVTNPSAPEQGVPAQSFSRGFLRSQFRCLLHSYRLNDEVWIVEGYRTLWADRERLAAFLKLPPVETIAEAKADAGVVFEVLRMPGNRS